MFLILVGCICLTSSTPATVLLCDIAADNFLVFVPTHGKIFSYLLAIQKHPGCKKRGQVESMHLLMLNVCLSCTCN